MLRNRKLLLDVLAMFFGISAWISINGVWVELPLMVSVLPEQWALAASLSVVIQVANIGPISYSLLRWRFGQIRTNVLIYALLALGCLASLLLMLLWDKTSTISGSEHSTSLFVLVFFLAFVDCTSSVLFMPYMVMFRKIYLNSYLVGEGLSGFLPALVALAQGVGGNPYCRNVTSTNSGGPDDSTAGYHAEPVYPAPRFSVSAFFSVIMVMMLISTAAFLLLDTLKRFDSERVAFVEPPRSEASDQPAAAKPESATSPGEEASTLTRQQHHIKEEEEEHAYKGDAFATKFALMLALQTFACFVSNGALPSIQTYSCLPYGNVVYHLAVTLNAMANPLMAFTAFFLPCRDLRIILGLIVTGTIFVAFILATALYSPDKLAGQDAGGALTVISWIVYGGLFSYAKVSIAGWCRLRSDKALFWYGVWTQVGSAIGSVLAYVLVNSAGVFQQYYVTC